MRNLSTNRARNALIWAALLSVYIIWGSTYLAIRFAIETLPPFLMASFRFFTAGLLMFAWRRFSGDALPTARQWRDTAVVGLFLLLGGNGLVVWAEQYVSSSIAALMVASVPLWIVLLQWLRSLRGKEKRPALLTVVGVLIGFGGIFILVGPSQGSLSVAPLGALALLAATFLWAFGSLYSRTADLPSSPLMGTAAEMLWGGAGLLVAGTLNGEWARLDVAAASPRSLIGLGYLIFFGSLIAFTAYTWLLRNVSTSLVATYAYVNPVVAIFLGAWLASEPLTPRTFVAAAVILGAVILISVAQNSAKKAAARLAAESAPAD